MLDAFETPTAQQLEAFLRALDDLSHNPAWLMLLEQMRTESGTMLDKAVTAVDPYTTARLLGGVATLKAWITWPERQGVAYKQALASVQLAQPLDK